MSPSWGVSRALPAADKARRASGRGRQGTSLLRQTKGLPGTAIGRATAPHQNNFILYPGVAQLVGRLLWDCEIGNSSKIPYTSKKPLILRFFRFHIFCKYAIIGLRPHSVPQLRNFCKNPSIKLNISGCGAVGSARHLGCRCRRFEPCHSDQILTEF